MPLNRIALLIGSEDSKHGRLQGVPADKRRFKDFLMEAAGGAWRPDEIHEAAKPTRQQLRELVAKANGADYAVVLFGGHGYCRKESDANHICINDNEDVSVDALLTTAKRQT